jgi:hypothetical protein
MQRVQVGGLLQLALSEKPLGGPQGTVQAGQSMHSARHSRLMLITQKPI